MSAFVLLCVCLGLGLAFSRSRQIPASAPAAINFWVINIALPALVLVQVPRLPLNASLVFAAAGPWLVLLGALALFAWLGRRGNWNAGTIGALVLTCGLGNTAYMGLPLIEALRGSPALGTAIIADQLGSFLALSTLGVAIAAYYSGSSAKPVELIRRVVLFPAFVALVVAFAVRGLGGWPPWCVAVLSRIGDTLTPLALFSVGLQFRFGDLSLHAPRVATGLAWKLVLAPLVILAIGSAMRVHGDILVVTVLQCAMAPMITAGILAEQHGLNPPLANTIVGIGVLISLATVPVWSALL
jgi:malate permease and related proteins